MKNLKVSMKLVISFSIVLVLAIVVGVVGILGMSSINSAGDDLYNENVIAISAMGGIRENLQRQIVQTRNIVINAGDSDKIRDHQNSIAALEKDIEALFADYEKTIVDPSLEGAYYEAKELYLNDYSAIKARLVEASMQSREAGYEVMFDPQVAQLGATLVNNFDVSMRNNDTWAKETVDDNTALFTSMLIIEFVVLAAAVASALFLTFYISSLISKPLNLLSAFMKKAGTSGDLKLSPEDVELIGKCAKIKDEMGVTINNTSIFVQHVTRIAEELERLAEGDLTAEIDVLSESDTLGISLQKLESSMNDMFQNIQTSATQVSSGAKQVADGSQALAQGATEQAASIEQLSSSIAEIANKTKENATTAGKTSRLSESIRDNAMKGSRQMDDMISAVKEINEASHSISKIIKTIDDIAFQTNILALNAAVEAARAGQHGKGFAVVAEEVRNLASKSAEAAKDTGNMIQNSMEKAELGSQIAGETASSLKEIVTGINESNQLVVEIARASEEQSLGISQINTGIDQVAQVIQQNSATAEESAAASEEMSGQSDVLQQLIAQFKLKGDLPGNKRLADAGRQAKRLPAAPRKADFDYAPDRVAGNFGKY